MSASLWSRNSWALRTHSTEFSYFEEHALMSGFTRAMLLTSCGSAAASGRQQEPPVSQFSKEIPAPHRNDQADERG